MNNYEYFEEDEEENGVLDLAEPEDESGGSQVEQRDSSSISKMAQRQTNKKIEKTVKKAITKGAAKQSLLTAIGPILVWIFIILVIIIIIIGLVMFLITLPGMAMEKIKSLAKNVGDALGNFFGTDQTTDIEETDIYTTLDYLNQMGYDLKGWGFLTDYVGDAKDGVEKNDDGTISNAKSDFISTYLISENYLYTLKNKNHVTGDGEGGLLNGILGLGQSLLSFLTNGQLSQYWSRGFISIYFDKELGEEGEFYQDHILSGDKITISASSKTIEIKRGRGNNSMTYNLDGWVGRYGVPIDFLVSVHLATMMPDLAYDIATSFETELVLLLHKVGGGEGDENTAIGYYKTPSGDYKAYDDFYNAAASGITSWINGWRVSKKEALNIMKEFGIPSPEECTGPAKKADGSEPAVDDDDDSTDIDLGGKCSESGSEATKACAACREHIQKIYDYLKVADVDKLDVYQPYIQKVKDHWYRDVYFATKKSEAEFVSYDYEYETMMKERWTLYETNDEGEYVLYKADSEGKTTNEKYDGTAEEAEKEGIKVVKKAVMTDLNSDGNAEDLGWNEIANMLVAYEVEEQSNSSFDPVYPDIDESEADYEIKKDIYVKIVTTGNVVQTGEGQRKETNEKIKKMFLNNKYFVYDGTPKRAEIITKLRKDNNIAYGALSEEKGDLDKTITMQEGTEQKTYKVSDYASNVTLTEKSLSAFSMLENTHTLDADYIYRDFKELIVELGYFTKEELTDETPKLLQWLIPDLGSYGFPVRVLDKNENEEGTMIHSEGDYKANEKNALKALIDAAPPTTEDPEENGSEPSSENNYGKAKIVNEETNIIGQVATVGTNPIRTLKEVGAIADIPEAKYTFTSSGSPSAAGTKTGDLEIDGVAYEVWRQTKSTCTLYAFAFIAQAYTGESPENYLKTSSGSFINATGNGQGSNEYWSGGFIGTSFEKVGIPGKKYHPGDANIAEDVATALGEGKPVYFYGNLGASVDRHAIVLLGSEDGKVLYYNPRKWFYSNLST